MQRHAESGPPAGPLAGRAPAALGNVRTSERNGTSDEQQNGAVAAARPPTAAVSTPRGAADDASDAGTDRDGATQLRKRGTSKFGRAEEGPAGGEAKRRERKKKKATEPKRGENFSSSSSSSSRTRFLDCAKQFFSLRSSPFLSPPVPAHPPTGILWTREEHRAFLEGLRVLGKVS